MSKRPYGSVVLSGDGSMPVMAHPNAQHLPAMFFVIFVLNLLIEVQVVKSHVSGAAGDHEAPISVPRQDFDRCQRISVVNQNRLQVEF